MYLQISSYASPDPSEFALTDQHWLNQITFRKEIQKRHKVGSEGKDHRGNTLLHCAVCWRFRCIQSMQAAR